MSRSLWLGWFIGCSMVLAYYAVGIARGEYSVATATRRWLIIAVVTFVCLLIWEAYRYGS